MLGNMKFISRAEQEISLDLFNTRNKFHISAQPCNIPYIRSTISLQKDHYRLRVQHQLGQVNLHVQGV